MGQLKNLITGYALVILFAMSLFLFMIQFLSYNNPSSSIINNTFVQNTSESFQETAEDVQVIAQKSKDVLETDSNPLKAVSYPFLIIYAGFSVIIGFLGFLTNGLLLIPTTLFSLIFGAGGTQGDSNIGYFVVFSVINGILLVGIVLAVLRGMRTGDT
jgi:hypothetical protein